MKINKKHADGCEGILLQNSSCLCVFVVQKLLLKIFLFHLASWRLFSSIVVYWLRLCRARSICGSNFFIVSNDKKTLLGEPAVAHGLVIGMRFMEVRGFSFSAV